MGNIRHRRTHTFKDLTHIVYFTAVGNKHFFRNSRTKQSIGYNIKSICTEHWAKSVHATHTNTHTYIYISYIYDATTDKYFFYDFNPFKNDFQPDAQIDI